MIRIAPNSIGRSYVSGLSFIPPNHIHCPIRPRITVQCKSNTWCLRRLHAYRRLNEEAKKGPKNDDHDHHDRASPSRQSPGPSPAQSKGSGASAKRQSQSLQEEWDDNPDFTIQAFNELPSSDFGVNQHMLINAEFKEALRQILWQFRAPIRYAFAYGSGVFPQSATPAVSSTSIHPKSPDAVKNVQGGKGKVIDFIFGVSYSQHWHSLNLQQHRDHYSFLGYFGSYVISQVQDRFGAGVYFHPYVPVNGVLIKYGVVNLDTICTDLSEWTTLYLAGRLQKPVKILRDDPRVRLANQINLLSALRTALLLLPTKFTEKDLYSTIAGISYLGDPRMAFPTENPRKVANIVEHQLPNFRRLYAPLIANLPNVMYHSAHPYDPNFISDPTANVTLEQDMALQTRGNMVRRLPKAFREKVYFAFQSKYQIPQRQFDEMLEASKDEDENSGRIKRRLGGEFERRVAGESEEVLRKEVSGAIRRTIKWPATVQSLKGPFTAGPVRTTRYLFEKVEKWREGSGAAAEGKPAGRESKIDRADGNEGKEKKE